LDLSPIEERKGERRKKMDKMGKEKNGGVYRKRNNRKEKVQ
jgi:hypothetical protein